MRASRGCFTLIELLIAIGVIAIIAGGVFVALDPVKRFQDSRNTRRWNDVNSILTAIHEYIVDHGGDLPPGVDTTTKQLGTCLSGGATPCTGAAAACVDISSDLAKYLVSMPVDPQGSAATTGYSIVANSDNLVTVTACSAEGQSISVSR